ncbi:hypothetical protein NMS60_002517 [Vibrio cholerae]|nr:hypothetical protein [Vibrio cholerae]EJL6687430.1 hypothetical protein [Vibrio cholerae]
MKMNKELEQANVVLAKAREVLKKSEENLNKSLKANDLALVQHRELAYALSCLVHPFNTMVPLSDGEIEQLKQSLKNIPYLPLEFVPKEPVFSNGRMIGFVDYGHERVEHRDIYDIVHAINVLAMANTDVLHIFTRFAGHVNSVEVYALSAETIYSDSYPQERLLSERVRLDEDNPLESLLAIESQLTELIIEAREAAVTPATEQAEVKA